MNTIQTIKGLFFDFDGVITMEKEGTPTILSYISKVTHIPYEIIDKAYRPYNNDLLYGYITHKQMWKVFCDKIGYDIEYEVLEKSFMNVTLDPKMIQYIKAKKDSYLIGMITDNKSDRIDTIVNNSELKNLFDIIVISANVHSRKSEKTIFEEALKLSRLDAYECVFIDNTLANLQKPREMGFTTIYFDDEKRDYSKLIF